MSDHPYADREAALQAEIQRLRQELRQAERTRVLWQNAINRLKQARRELLETRAQLQESNATLARHVEELEQAKRYVEALAYSDRQVVEHIREGVLITDLEGRILAVNPAFTRTTGYPEAEVVGQNASILNSGQHPSSYYRQMWRSLKHRGHWHGEIWNRCRDGSVILQLLSISTVRDWEGRGITHVAVFTDISERKRMEEALREREQTLRSVTAALAEGVLLVAPDGNISFANPEAAKLLRQSRPHLINQPLAAVLRLQHHGSAVLHPREGDAPRREDRLERTDGTTIDIAFSARPLPRGPQGQGTVISFRDISARKRTEARLVTLSRAVEESPAAVIIAHPNGVIDYVNPAFTRLTGFSAEEVHGRRPDLLQTEETPASVLTEMRRTLASGAQWSGELVHRRKDGGHFWALVSISPIRDGDGQISRYVAIEEDITERKESEAHTWRQANYDALTHLPNRRLFMDRLHQAVAQSQRTGERVALAFLDLDEFKQVNDHLGHDAGDELLRQAAQRIRSCLRASDTVARLAGDEFTLILGQIEPPSAVEAVAEKLVATLAEPFDLDGKVATVTVSIGITLCPDDAQEIPALLKNADAAMYRAKAAGRNTYRFFTDEINREAGARVALERDLRHALAQGELAVEYQPIVALGDGTIVAAEALMRWRRQGEALVHPGAFLGAADELGLLGAFGHWLLATACQTARPWAEARPGFRLTVNISASQLRVANFVDELRAILRESGFPPDQLQLEVNEDTLGADPLPLQTLTQAISDLGVRLAIDRFGSGYASLHSLVRLHAETLKIDGAFVAAAPTHADPAAIVATAHYLGRKLGMQVIATGVEGQKQLEYLKQIGCAYGQGYHLGRPMAATALSRLLALPP